MSTRMLPLQFQQAQHLCLLLLDQLMRLMLTNYEYYEQAIDTNHVVDIVFKYDYFASVLFVFPNNGIVAAPFL